MKYPERSFLSLVVMPQDKTMTIAHSICYNNFIFGFNQGGIPMSLAKQKMREIIESQPEDASYDEIIRELAFERMMERGLKDASNGRAISNEEMKRRIKTWQK